MVRWPVVAVVTLRDVRIDAERWGGVEGRLLLMARAKTTSGGRGIGFVHGFVNYYGWFFLAQPRQQ
jgi:hypothetical protein